MKSDSPVNRTAHQICDADGKPYQTAVSSNVWVSGANVFSPPTENNNVIPFTTGEDYFKNLMSAVREAKSEICIAGWQINWDALLAEGVRLYDLLYEVVAANKALNVYVMPWQHSVPVETYDEQTARVLQFLNDELKTNQIRVLSSPSYANQDQRYFSHHQKQVVIDRKIAFVGGMDIAYGRFDDNAYELLASSRGREAMNRYNGCVAQVGTVRADTVVDPDRLTGAWDRLDVPLVGSDSNASKERAKLRRPGHWQMKYGDAGTFDSLTNAKQMASDTPDLTTLDPKTQPRMPWQDVHCRVEGPAVAYLLKNFVMRWNVEADSKNRLPMPTTAKDSPAAGKMHVQVLRSAPAGHCKKEVEAIRPKPATQQSTAKQDNIHQAMLSLIEKSRRFIYIENQFFVSDFGQEAPRPADLGSAARFIDMFGGSSQNATAQKMAWNNSQSKMKLGSFDRGEMLHPPTNGVCNALIQRIRRAIMDKHPSPFHVYITLPVHSEGLLCKAGIAVQVYWTMQTLVFGSQSLLNGIRRSIKAKELFDAGESSYERVYRDENAEYESVPLEKCWEYVTLLNLRNWTKVDDHVLTEQIYVHSKLMIVDDLYALIGSANVNDRSLLGDRDSELAVLVVDGSTRREDINGKGSRREVRLFAHDLRKQVWRKLFGIAGGVRPAKELAQAIDEPGKPDSWRLIQRRAQKNAELYEAAFPWVPRSWVTDGQGEKMPASILPPWDSEAEAPAGSSWGRKGKLKSPMPFETRFWSVHQHIPSAVDGLNQIKGFVTALPVMWTKGENNRFVYPTSLVADNDLPATLMPSTTPTMEASLTDPKSSAALVG
jgi:phospholipase D1/2